MKIYALYLPQFYETEENNKWWGKGYTEWTAVKRSKPFFEGQKQPIKPYNEFYYDLTEKDTMIWQSLLAKKYGINGFVIYHYWYSGKLMLEKPCELLYANKDIDIEYCFCWANHPWTKAWDGKNHYILQEQTYGGKDEWRKHFEYFEKFFDDARYTKVNNRPVIYIYNASDIPNYEDMVEYWDKLAVERGYFGIFIVQFISSKNTRPLGRRVDAVFEDEPLFSARFEYSWLKKIKRVFAKVSGLPDIMDYDYTWKKIIEKSRTYNGIPIIQGAFCSFDNTPRRGDRGTTVFNGSTPQKFGIYLKRLINTTRRDASNDFLVINAWNEWGETAMLEPSDIYEFGYLQAVKDAIDLDEMVE